jgi:HAMP domain-containing protein/HPt (histidine-containing phosphotransfer) domain-containing protein
MIRTSLTLRLNATILGIVLVMTSMMVLASSYYLYQRTIQDLRLDADQTASLAQLSLIDRLWDFDSEGVNDIAHSLLLDETFAIVSIRDKSGHIQLKLQGEGFEQASLERFSEDDFFRVTRKISKGTDEIGQLDVLVSTHIAHQRILGNTVNILIASIILSIILTGSISLAADRLIKRPIFKLRKETDEVINGNLLSPIDLSRDDELGALARDFAHMRDSVREKIGIIEQQNFSLEQKVQDRTAQLEQKTKELTAVFSSLQEGIVTFSRTQKLDPQPSPYLLEIFGIPSVEGRSLGDLLFGDHQKSDAAAQCLSALDAILGSSDLNFDFNRFLLPRDHVITVNGRTRILDLSWSPVISDAGTVEKMVLCVRDITEIQAVRALARSNQETVRCLQELMSCEANTYNLFFDALPGRISNIRELILLNSQDSVRDAMRSLHTIKGNSRTFGFSALSDKTHEIEGLLKEELQGTPILRDNQKIMMQLIRLQEIYQQYQDVRYKVLKIAQSEIKITFGDLIDEFLKDLQGHESPAAQELSRRLKGVFGQQDLRMTLESMGQSALPSIARDCLKPAPSLRVQGDNIYLPADRLTLLSDVFMHLFRNSMDHGIEAPMERDRLRKSSQGQIEVSINRDGDHLEIIYQDDGHGLDIKRTREVMIKQGMLAADAQPSRQELQNAIFADGFSTAERVTVVSGRGVGMSAVRNMIQHEGGSIHCEILGDDNLKDGTAALRWIIRLPLHANKDALKSVS